MACLTSKVEIYVSCRKLADKDVLSKSDPLAVLYMKLSNQASYVEVGRTEKITNSLNPDFARPFEVDYFFEQQQHLRFQIFDVDSENQRLDKQDYLGSFDCTLAELVSRNKMERPLTGTRGVKGSIILSCQEVKSCKECFSIQLAAQKLDNKDFMGKSDPFIEIWRATDRVTFQPGAIPPAHTNFIVVHRTEVIKNDLNPSWRPFSISARKLCDGDDHRLLRFDCYDWDSDGSHDIIGSFYTSKQDLLTHFVDNPTHTYPFINQKYAAKKKKYENSGKMIVKSFGVTIEHTFFDYVSGGMELTFTVGIDFTGSNGNPSNPQSLHYRDPSGMPNQYEVAIRSVGEIIQEYDTDKQFPALGFGARIPPKQEVSHCFPINFQPNNPFCFRVEGLLTSYSQCIQSVQLYGPTNFSPIIQHVAQFARTYCDGSKYFVLLIITDGIISDMRETIEAIIEASKLPMSIIIVGVGREDFTAMDALDCDNGRLKVGSKVAERDIVQFVPMRTYEVSTGSFSQVALAKAVLAELPSQVTDWMKKHGIQPRPPQSQLPHPGGHAPYPGGQPPHPGGHGPYPGGQPPHPGGHAPYPGGQPPHPGGQAPYPGGQPPHPGGQAPYPGGQAPYPGGQPPHPGGQAPYPGGQAPYPGGQPPHPGGQVPYPGGQAPYPGGQAPYPGGQAPYPGGQAPYPGGQAPCPEGQPPHDKSSSYPSGGVTVPSAPQH